MGGREVGGLANQLAAHMDIGNAEHRQLVQSFWQSPRIADSVGLKAVDLFDAVDIGEVIAIWIMATNPAVSLPQSKKIQQALEKCEFVVVSDCVRHTDTTRYADVLLPAQAWGERDGTVTNSERRISRQRAFLKAPDEAYPDWWIVSQVANRMGYAEQFSYNQSVDIFNEHAALSAYKNSDSVNDACCRDFNISALSDLSLEEYSQLQPVQWPVIKNTSPASRYQGTKRMFADGRFFTDSGKAQFIAINNPPKVNELTEQYPMRLNSGRIRDQWHTMTRTGQASKLTRHIYEPFVEVNPQDALCLSLRQDELAQVTSQQGDVICRVVITDTQKQGNLFIPIHWSEQFSGRALVDSLVNSVIDPVSGQPEFKSTPVMIKPYSVKWYGFILSRCKLNDLDTEYWSCSRGEGVWRYELASEQLPDNWSDYARGLLCRAAMNPEWSEYHDVAMHRYRAARFENGQLQSCMFVGSEQALPERGWLQGLFAQQQLDAIERASILAGKPPGLQKDSGRIVCSCFNVGVNTLLEAIQTNQLVSTDEVGKLLRAGTNCGSCLPEISSILQSSTH
jgi:assimilatory nitrate reductase catalytic subunit